MRKINYNIALLYVVFLAAFGPFGELLVGNLYQTVVGYPLWQYHVLPIHHGYTSLIAPIVWGIGGLVMYTVCELARIATHHRKRFRAMYIAGEIFAIEFMMNVLFRFVTGEYIFYYTPGELWHFTSIQTVPFYYLAGLAVLIVIERFRKEPLFAVVFFTVIMFVLVFLTN